MCCNFNTCFGANNKYESNEDIKKKYYTEDGKVKLPEEIKLCYDKECNNACITCRDKLIKNDEDDLLIFSQIEQNFKGILDIV